MLRFEAMVTNERTGPTFGLMTTLEIWVYLNGNERDEGSHLGNVSGSYGDTDQDDEG